MLRLGERRGRIWMIRKIRDEISRKIYEGKHRNTAPEEGKRRDCPRCGGGKVQIIAIIWTFFLDNRVSGLINTNI